MPRAQGPPCPCCGRPTRISTRERSRRRREKHPDKVRAYNKHYYETVTKPKRQGAEMKP